MIMPVDTRKLLSEESKGVSVLGHIQCKRLLQIKMLKLEWYHCINNYKAIGKYNWKQREEELF